MRYVGTTRKAVVVLAVGAILPIAAAPQAHAAPSGTGFTSYMDSVLPGFTSRHFSVPSSDPYTEIIFRTCRTTDWGTRTERTKVQLRRHVNVLPNKHYEEITYATCFTGSGSGYESVGRWRDRTGGNLYFRINSINESTSSNGPKLSVGWLKAY